MKRNLFLGALFSFILGLLMCSCTKEYEYDYKITNNREDILFVYINDQLDLAIQPGTTRDKGMTYEGDDMNKLKIEVLLEDYSVLDSKILSGGESYVRVFEAEENEE